MVDTVRYREHFGTYFCCFAVKLPIFYVYWDLGCYNLYQLTALLSWTRSQRQLPKPWSWPQTLGPWSRGLVPWLQHCAEERELLGLEQSLSVSLVIKKGKLMWFGQVECNNDSDRIKHCTTMEVKGAKPTGRLRKSWWAGVKEGAKPTGRLRKSWWAGVKEEAKPTRRLRKSWWAGVKEGAKPTRRLRKSWWAGVKEGVKPTGRLRKSWWAGVTEGAKPTGRLRKSWWAGVMERAKPAGRLRKSWWAGVKEDVKGFDLHWEDAQSHGKRRIKIEGASSG